MPSSPTSCVTSTRMALLVASGSWPRWRAFLNERYGEGTVTVTIKEQYPQHGRAFCRQDFLIGNALAANRDAGVEPRIVPVRGGHRRRAAHLPWAALPKSCHRLDITTTPCESSSRSLRSRRPFDVLEASRARFATGRGPPASHAPRESVCAQCITPA